MQSSSPLSDALAKLTDFVLTSPRRPADEPFMRAAGETWFAGSDRVIEEWEATSFCGYLAHGHADALGDRAIDRFLRAPRSDLSADERAALEVVRARAHASLFEIVEVRLDVGLALLDRVSGEQFLVRVHVHRPEHARDRREPSRAGAGVLASRADASHDERLRDARAGDRLGRALHGEGTARASEWAHAQCARVEQGAAKQVLQALRFLHPSGSEAQDKVEQLVGYLENNLDRTDYPSYRARGLRVSSSSVESANFHVTGARLKPQGMRWSARGAAQMAALSADLFNGVWDQRTRQILAA
jgi:hypothetical protein